MSIPQHPHHSSPPVPPALRSFFAWLLLSACAIAPVSAAQRYAFTTLAGAPAAGSADGVGSAARFFQPRGVAVDNAGNVYVADSRNATIRKITPTGVVTTLAGLAGSQAVIDGAGAAARFDFPAGIAVDAGGTVYVTDRNFVRKITPSGLVSTLAGGWSSGGADGFGTAAQFHDPAGLAVDGAGTVYVADTSNNTIRTITPAGVVSTLAGLAGFEGFADGIGSAARFSRPSGVAVDAAGNVYVADSGNYTIRAIAPDGTVTTLAGVARNFGSVDGSGIDARFGTPWAIAFDGIGTLYVADLSFSVIRKVTVAGVAGTLVPNGSGLQWPQGVAVDSTHTVYIADTNNHSIKQVPAGGALSAFAGFTGGTFLDGTGSAARFKLPRALAVDAAGTVYVADTFNSAIRKITAGAVVTTIASAGFSSPMGVAVDGAGVVYVADTYSNTIKKIAADGTVTTLAGLAFTNGTADGVGTDARFNQPAGIAVDASGTVYVADTSNHTIRTITPAGAVATLAGFAGSTGNQDGPDGASARFYFPTGIAVDSLGTVYVADTYNNAIRTITAAGVVGTLAGGSFGPTDGTGTLARFSNPQALTVASDGSVFVADTVSCLIRRITPAGVVATVAGSAYNRGAADGTGAAARFWQPSGIAIDSAGTVFVADTLNNTIRAGTAVPSTGIAGRVINATTTTGQPGVFIYVYDATGFFAGYAQTDAGGNYSVDELAPGTYYARTFNSQGLLDQLFDNKPCNGGGCIVTTGNPIVVSSGAMTTADFALSPGARITGHVKNIVTGDPVANVSIFVVDAAGKYATSGYTDTSGDYTTFAAVAAGSYYARTFAGPGFDNQLYQNRPCVAGCDPLTGTAIPVGGGVTTTGIDFSLSPSPSAMGHIVGRAFDDMTGAPISNVTVTVYNAAGAAVPAGVTDATGTYASPPLPDGTYFAKSSNAGVYSDQLYNRIACALGCSVTTGTSISVSSTTSTPAVDFFLRLKVGFGGTVTDPDAQPIAGITVALYNGAGVQVQQVVTDGAGTYRFPDLPEQQFFARTHNAAGYLDELYNNIACALGCDVRTGTVISMSSSIPMPPVDFEIAPNTPAGSSVVVTPVDQNGAAPVTVTYASVATGVRTILTMLSTWPPLPAGYVLGTPPIVFDVSLLPATASVTAPITLCVKYAGTAFANPSRIRLLHDENGAWMDVTATLDQTLGIVCGTTSSLSPFAVAETVTVITPDTTPPEIWIASPAPNASYALNQAVAVSYTCTDDVSLASCDAPIANGGQLDTSIPGPFTFTVNAMDAAGNPSTKSVSYSVLDAPTITVTSPSEPIYERGSTVVAQYVCGNAVTCIGDVANGALLDTSTPGLKNFTITATDAALNTTTTVVSYTVSLGACVTPFQGLTAWLPGDGSAAERVGGTQALWTGTATYAAGQVGQAFSVGSGNDVSLPFQQAGPFTLQAWVRTSNRLQPAFTGVLSTGLPGQPATTLQIELDGSGNYRLNVGNGDVSWLIGPATDAFQHVAVTFGQSVIAVYLNGQLVQSGVWIGSPGLGFQILNVGIDREGTLLFTGLVDEVQVFNRALTAYDVLQTFEAGADGLCKNRPPLAVAAASNNPAEATGGSGANVMLDGSGSSDPDANDVLAYTWSEGLTSRGTGSPLTVLLSLGFHTITLTVDDGHGLTSSSDVTVLVRDTTPPAVSIVSPVADANYSLDQTVFAAFSCADSVSLTSCTGTLASGSQIDTSIAGSFFFTVTAEDGAGHVSAKTVSYTVLEPPTITVTSPSEPIYERGSTVVAQYVCGNAVTCVGNVVNGALLDTSTPGLKSLTITATDAANNQTTALVNYTVSLGACVMPFQGLTAWLPGDSSAAETVNLTQATWIGTGSYAAGQVAQAFSVGTGNYVSLPFQQAGPFTLQAWARTPNGLQPEFTGVLSTGLPGQPATTLQIELDGTGNYRLNVGNSDVSWLIGPATDFFQHIAVTFDASTLAVYLNGQLVQSDVWLGSSPLGFQILNVGIDREGTLPFTGLVDEVQVFNRALAAGEVLQTFEAGADGLCKDQPPVAVAVASDNPAEATGANGAIVTLDGAASSDPDINDVLTYVWREGLTSLGSGKTLAALLSLGSHVITLTVDDGHQHTSSSDVTVLVRDMTPPAFAFVMTDITKEAAGPSGAVASWTIPIALDVVDGFVDVGCTYASGSTFPLGTTRVKCSATDAHDNERANEFTVFVNDTVAPTVQITSPTPDALLSGSSVDVVLQAADVVGVAGVTVNGIAAAPTGGTPQAGTWHATVPIGLPVAPGNALRFDARAVDAAGNPGTGMLLIDNDAIPSALDHSRNGGADQSGIYSNDFNNGVTAGTLTRNGWTVKLSSASTAGAVRATASGAGTIARMSACVGVAKEVRLDITGETADVTCNPSTGTITVKAISAVPQIELREQLGSGAWQQFNLRTGQLMSVGSPATASSANTTPIVVQLLQIDDAGGETVVGGYQLAPGASVDVAVIQGAAGEDHQVRFHVLRGRVPVTVDGVTQTLEPGAPGTLRIHRARPDVAGVRR